MTDNAGPTIVLIGGKATLDSGATVDSRQALAGDEWDLVLRQALGSSEAWWTLAKDFVDVVLDQHQQTDAWALAWIGKTLMRARADGSIVPVRTKTFLDQAEDFLETPNQSSGFRSDAISSRYRLLGPLLRFESLQGGPPPAVIVGGMGVTYDDGTYDVNERPLDYCARRWPDAVIVLPHTPSVEAKARRVLLRLATAPSELDEGPAWQMLRVESPRDEDPSERGRALRRSRPHVLSHDFHVSFWADDGVLRDPADLDAALTFVKSRYDLNLGLWDLARDPALREVLLTREQRPRPASPQVAVPEELAAKASEKAAERREAEAAELEARRRHHEAIWPLLSPLGWHFLPRHGEGVSYRWPAGPGIPSGYWGGDVAVLFLELQIQKRNAVLALYERTRTGKTDQFLHDHREVIAEITGSTPDDTKQVMWRIADKGWAGSPEGWPTHIETIQSLIRALAPDLQRLGEIASKELQSGRLQPGGRSRGRA